MEKKVSYVVRLIDKTKEGINSVKTSLNQLKTTGTGVSAALAGGFSKLKEFLTGPVGIAGAVGAVAGAIGLMKKAVGESFRFESIAFQFKRLTGSAEEAKARMEDIQRISNKPFPFEGLSAASQILHRMSDGKLGQIDKLFLSIGDAAVDAGTEVEDMAKIVGTLYASLQQGRPISSVATQLDNMGVITGAVRTKMIGMQDAGKSAADIWEVFAAAIGKHSGAMEEAASLGDSLIDQIGGEMTRAFQLAGDGAKEVAEGGLAILLEAITKLNDNGTLERWGANIGGTLAGVAEKVEDLIAGFRWLNSVGAAAGVAAADALANASGSGMGAGTRPMSMHTPGEGPVNRTPIYIKPGYTDLGAFGPPPEQRVQLNSVNTQNVLSINGVRQDYGEFIKGGNLSMPSANKEVVDAVNAQTDVLKTAVSME